MSAKAKRVLPTRPRPPGPEQLLEDVSGARARDPVLAPPAEPPAGASEGAESLFGQSRRYVELNQRLQESGGRLRAGCEALRRAGHALELSVARMRQSAR